MTKLKDSKLVDEYFGMQDYIKNMTLVEEPTLDYDAA